MIRQLVAWGARVEKEDPRAGSWRLDATPPHPGTRVRPRVLDGRCGALPLRGGGHARGGHVETPRRLPCPARARAEHGGLEPLDSAWELDEGDCGKIFTQHLVDNNHASREPMN